MVLQNPHGCGSMADQAKPMGVVEQLLEVVSPLDMLGMISQLDQCLLPTQATRHDYVPKISCAEYQGELHAIH